MCAPELADIFSVMFNLSFQTRSVPALWKQSCIVPVPKKSVITCLNDFRPIALTSVPMKVCERIFLNHFKPIVTPFLDPMQFAYQSKRSCEDAVLLLLDRVYSHLENSRSGHHARLMFFDFSSAFNTIRPHILIRKLIDLSVIPFDLIEWCMDYLTNRTQFVKLSSSIRSAVTVSNIGAPQGTVAAPFLFTLYTADIRSSMEMCPLVKFADDSAIVGLIDKDDDRAYLQQVQVFVEACEKNFLELNVSKTKEMVIEFRKNVEAPIPVTIRGTEVERTRTYKYLGVTLNDKLTWGDHVDTVIKKLNARSYCLRKMASFNVRTEILTIFYNSILCNVWRYCLICWGGNASKSERNRIDGVIKRAGRVIGKSQQSVDTIYQCVLQSKLDFINNDESHPLYGQLCGQCRAGGNGRLRLPVLRTNRYRDSFIPRAIKCYNANFKR